MITVDAKNIHTFTFSYGWQLFSGAYSLTLSSACSKWGYWKFSNLSFSNFSILWIQIPVKSSGRTYRRSYFYLNNILKLKKESSAKTFITTRATRHPGPQGLTYCSWILHIWCQTKWNESQFCANILVSPRQDEKSRTPVFKYTHKTSFSTL